MSKIINYRSFDDLAKCIKANIHILPDFDLIVGIPRSGMIPAYMIGMFLNKPVCSLDELINEIPPSSGYSREISRTDVSNIIIVDDSIHSGVALSKTKEKLKQSNISANYNIKFLAIYARAESKNLVDYYFEIVPLPRLFQWNYLNVKKSEEFCYDIDGVLCVDPTPEENDDGPRYREFILNAKPLYIPKSKIYAIVTSRLEKYRKETEYWLKKNNVSYEYLFMFDLPSKEERLRQGSHAKFKAKVYSELNASLFIESNDSQAKEIALLTKKPVICVETDHFYTGNDNHSVVSASLNNKELNYAQIKNKKILLFSHEFTYTGAPHSLLRIAKILIENNYYVEVWGPRYGPFVKEFENINVKVRIIPYDDLSEHRNIEIMQHFDLSIVNTAIPYQYYLFSVKYCPTIWYIREATNLEDICKSVPKRRNALEKADKLYCVSEYAKEYIVKNFNKNTFVIHNCVEDEKANKNYYLKPVGEVVNILQMGTISARKSFDILVDSYQTLPENCKKHSHLYLAGQLIDSQKEFYTKLFEKIANNPNITYIGEIKDDSEKIKLLCDMDLIVIASRDESCSLVALEGAMASKPLIVSKNVGAKYIVSKDSGWIVKTGDVNDLSKALEDAINQRSSLNIMGECSRRNYEKLSNIENYKKEIMKMVSSSLTDVHIYREEKELPPQQAPIYLRAWTIFKHEGFRKLLYETKKYLSSEKSCDKSIFLLGTSASKMPINMVNGCEVIHIKKCSILSAEYPKPIDYVTVEDNAPRQLSIDINKSLYDYIKANKMSFFMIDLLDERFNVCHVKYVSNKEIVFTKTDDFINNIEKIHIGPYNVSKELISFIAFDDKKYEEKITSFCKKIKDVYPVKNIIINEAYLVNQYYDNKGNIQQFDSDKIDHNNKVNQKLKRMYKLLKKNFRGCNLIKMPKNVAADVSHKQGLNPMHFNDSYYQYVKQKIEKIIGD